MAIEDARNAIGGAQTTRCWASGYTTGFG